MAQAPVTLEAIGLVLQVTNPNRHTRVKFVHNVSDVVALRRSNFNVGS